MKREPLGDVANRSMPKTTDSIQVLFRINFYCTTI